MTAVLESTQSSNSGTGGGSQNDKHPHASAGSPAGGQFTANNSGPSASDTKSAASAIAAAKAKKSGSGSSAGSLPPLPGTSRTMKAGDRGDDVRNLQYAMGLLGMKVPQDGSYDAQTAAAVKEIQSKLGINPTGHASGSLLRKIQDSVRLSPCVKESVVPSRALARLTRVFEAFHSDQLRAPKGTPGIGGRWIKGLLGISHEDGPDVRRGMGRVVSRHGSVLSVSLPARNVRPDDRVIDEHDPRRMGTVLALHPAAEVLVKPGVGGQRGEYKTTPPEMTVRWDDGKHERRPQSTVHDPIHDPRRSFDAEHLDAQAKLDAAVGGPRRPDTPSGRMHDLVASGAVVGHDRQDALDAVRQAHDSHLPNPDGLDDMPDHKLTSYAQGYEVPNARSKTPAQLRSELRKMGIGSPQVEQAKRIAEEDKANEPRIGVDRGFGLYHGIGPAEVNPPEGVPYSDAAHHFGSHPDSRNLSVSPERDAEVEAAIRDAFERSKYGRWATLAKLREKLGDRYPRQEVDNALMRMTRTPGVVVIPEVNQKALTPADRFGAVVIGGMDKHAISIEPHAYPTHSPAPTDADVLSAYQQHDPTGTGKWVSVAELRKSLGGTREEQDATLIRLRRTPGVSIVPEDNQKTLTPEDHAGAVMIGGREHHFMSIEPQGASAIRGSAPAPTESRAAAKVASADLSKVSDEDLSGFNSPYMSAVTDMARDGDSEGAAALMERVGAERQRRADVEMGNTPATAADIAVGRGVSKVTGEPRHPDSPRPAKATLSAADREKRTKAMTRRYASGASIDDIAAEHGVSSSTVHTALTKAGMQLRPRGGSTRVPAKKAAAKVAKAKAAFSVEDVHSRLAAATSRDEGREILSGLTMAQLREVSPTAAGARGAKTKPDLIESIVGLHVGGRLQFGAIRERTPDDGFVRVGAPSTSPAATKVAKTAPAKAPKPDVPSDADVLSAYQEHDPTGAGKWVSVAELRKSLGGTREEQDATLIRLRRTPGVSIVPEDNQKTLTPEDHAGAVNIGGRPHHFISIEPGGASAIRGGTPAPTESRAAAKVAKAKAAPREMSAEEQRLRDEMGDVDFANALASNRAARKAAAAPEGPGAADWLEQNMSLAELRAYANGHNISTRNPGVASHTDSRAMGKRGIAENIAGAWGRHGRPATPKPLLLDENPTPIRAAAKVAKAAPAKRAAKAVVPRERSEIEQMLGRDLGEPLRRKTPREGDTAVWFTPGEQPMVGRVIRVGNRTIIDWEGGRREKVSPGRPQPPSVTLYAGEPTAP